MSCWVLVVARNGAEHLPRTLDSLLGQTSKPKRIVVVDDGSTDTTPKILQNYAGEHEAVLTVITRPDRGYDIRRVPANINFAWKETANSGLKSDFFMISGDDCFYPARYVASLLTRMKADYQLVVASGRPSSSGSLLRERLPSGSGRMISSQFWKELGEAFPLKAGWEAWLVYRAVEEKLKVQLFDDLRYEHMRQRGSKHQFTYWGVAMQTLGYNTLYALGRIAKNALIPSIAPKRAINMLRGYFQAKLGSDDPFLSPFEPSLRSFVNQQQTRRIIEIVSSVL